MHRKALALSLAAPLLLLAGCASTPGASSAPTSDDQFMMEAARAGLAEIETGRLATERAQNPDVRQFGVRMVHDHTQANEELAAIAERAGVSLPDEPDQAHQDLARELAALQGNAFDRAYIDAMVRDHAHVVTMFERAAQSAQDPELRAFAEETLSTLEDHLRVARMIQRSLERGPAPDRQPPGTIPRDDVK